ncbi:AraC family transcriptional regulator [Flavobacterium sp.]|uniref:helix-turn-helix domain-containing protein n=1 Tax=Flavobacterium sp. TaxID=239 RepID=UPI00122766D8|nr:response regulator transcription factor [Flavobacterium sp.]RZJ72549.1 MAG: AraC family transcriptional regulator [Flavobacterium sp.]
MKATQKPQKFDSISALHLALGFPKPLHPLISLVNYADMKTPHEELPKVALLNFYKISFKKNLKGKLRYGQGHYDFDEGGFSFTAPNQILSSADHDNDYDGYTLLIHPDFLRTYPLSAKIKIYGFFSYSVNEALFLSDKEKQVIFSVFDNIRDELNNNLDDFSQDVIVSHIEVLLNYSNRFYKRQFLTRKTVNHDLLAKMELLLEDYFASEKSANGLPTVEFLADELHLSARYLSDMLRSLTGKNAQQHIHDKLIEKAKELLTATELSVAEIAYRLGFEQPQSLNRLFKKKTDATPLAFRQTFN